MGVEGGGRREKREPSAAAVHAVADGVPSGTRRRPCQERQGWALKHLEPCRVDPARILIVF
jgi:hypothetical protein